MKFEPDSHHRRSIRLSGYDYGSSGFYFVTLCLQHRESLLGSIAADAMQLNDAGRMVEDVWAALPQRFPQVTIDEYIAMPNHFHGIIIFNDPVGAPLAAPGVPMDPHDRQRLSRTRVSLDGSIVGAPLAAPGPNAPQSNPGADPDQGAASSVIDQGAASSVIDQGAASSAPTTKTLGEVIRAFKSISAIGVNRMLGRTGRPLWQRNYYEHIIRNEDDLHNARQYIRDNPVKWATDHENPANRE